MTIIILAKTVYDCYNSRHDRHGRANLVNARKVRAILLMHPIFIQSVDALTGGRYKLRWVRQRWKSERSKRQCLSYPHHNIVAWRSKNLDVR